MSGPKRNTVSVKIFEDTRDALEDEKTRLRRGQGQKLDYADLIEAAVQRGLASAAPQTESPRQAEQELMQRKPGPAPPDFDTLSLAEPREWAALAAVASQVAGDINRAMYRSIRFQLEFLALTARMQGVHEPQITIRFDDHGNLVVAEPNPASPLCLTDATPKPGRAGGRAGGQSATGEAPLAPAAIPRRRKASG